MRYFKRTICFILFSAFVILLTVYAAADALFATRSSTTFLICGIDDAAENTDTILLVKAESDKQKITILQIPRDTYVKHEGRGVKINSIYPTARLKGVDGLEAMKQLTSFIETEFGIEINAFLGLNTTSFVKIVDSVGGVTVELENDITIDESSGKTFKKGTNRLSGKDALLFIRHRKSYPDADIGRINAQKIFIKAFIARLKELSFIELLSLPEIIISNTVTDISVSSLPELAFLSQKEAWSNADFCRLPGSPILHSGKWYYDLNVCEADRLLGELFERKHLLNEEDFMIN